MQELCAGGELFDRIVEGKIFRKECSRGDEADRFCLMLVTTCGSCIRI